MSSASSSAVMRDTAVHETASKVYDRAMHSVTFFQHKPAVLKVQHGYSPSDDGQARIYDTPFVKLFATLRGERPWFADYHAWYEGRGALFPDLMATLQGERPLFANLIAIIQRWIKELITFFKQCFDTPEQEKFGNLGPVCAAA